MKIVKFSYILFLAALGACTGSQKSLTVSVSNPLNMERNAETVKVDLGALASSSDKIIVLDKISGQEIQSQLLDEDTDSTYESVLFQVDLKANESKEFSIEEGVSALQPTEVKTYGRFVPERNDDFTWENDKVAYRMYGPTLKKLAEEGKPGGGISGGVDCWLKKVDYSIINKWYKGYLEDPMYYHNDHGEGLDNYHVGPSLGCGGTGVMIGDELVTSANYTGYQVFLNGPIKTKFSLNYDPYGNDEVKVQEKKTISIELGDNLSKVVVDVKGTDVLTTGITLHEKAGEVTVDSASVFVMYDEPHFGTQLSTAIVVDPKYYAGYTHLDSPEKDKSHILLHLKAIDGKIVYYTGFTWSESKQFADQEAWKKYLANFAKQIQSPIEITVK